MSEDKTTEDRFWRKVDKTGGPDACWPWTGGIDDGYGKFKLDKKSVLSHRAALMFSGGIIPVGLFVLHKCDNRPCCNPKHLFVGTNSDNVADMVSKNRQAGAHGEKSGRAKLSNRRVLALKKLRSLGWRYRTLAVFFGISEVHVSNICRGRYRTRG